MSEWISREVLEKAVISHDEAEKFKDGAEKFEAEGFWLKATVYIKGGRIMIQSLDPLTVPNDWVRRFEWKDDYP